MIKGYKGFSKNMTCRGFQFEIGKSYHEDEAKACKSGFHFCENPIDIFKHYEPADSVFCEVEGDGKTDSHEEDTKIACTDITIKAGIRLHDLIYASIACFFNKRSYNKKTSKHSKTDSSASSATGNSSASSATGYSSASSATGDSSAAVCTGLYSKAMAGKYGCIVLAWWNEKKEMSEMRCSETGCGDGTDGKLKSGVWYEIDKDGNFVEEICGGSASFLKLHQSGIGTVRVGN